MASHTVHVFRQIQSKTENLKMVNMKQWEHGFDPENKTKRTQIIFKQATVAEVAVKLNNQVPIWQEHIKRVSLLQNKFRNMPKNVPDYITAVHLDFSENFFMVFRKMKHKASIGSFPR